MTGSSLLSVRYNTYMHSVIWVVNVDTVNFTGSNHKFQGACGFPAPLEEIA
ncbi:hypothetical protein EDD73_10299 [Heliophilum fasciatum]|uniref:Uncharacterized protein n=1 Tax=Heliophilum fasciatum TaxID=35700 RepID=A0A4R2RYM0_9FIRM|nr:hypothetical protein [Heliophilum fasciatum]TCP68703.1 hypothetical protein EDD73_10299 [Heliophilum fasciatum]